MEPHRDLRDGTIKKSVNPQMMVRTDFKEQKIEKFFLENNKPANEIEQEKILDISMAEEQYEKNHKLFLEGVENLEDKIMDCSENSILINNDGR